MTNWKVKERINLQASGTVVEESELDILLREINEKSLEATKEYENSNKKAAEREKAENKRHLAMEILGESQKRKNLDKDSPGTQKKRKTSSETLEYLRERSVQEFALRKQELQQKAEETALLKQLVLQNAQMVQAMFQNKK